jgi:phosphonate transport system substrate-binding protein
MQHDPNDHDTLTIALAPTVGADPGSPAQDPAALAAYLERTLGRRVRIVVEPSYADTVESLRAGRVDVAMVGELASLRGQEGGGIEPLVVPVEADGQAPTYQSVVVTRIDSGIHDLAALRGTTIGLVDEQSTSGYLVPRAMLREAGIDPDREITIRLYGRHRAVVEAVLAGEVIAGATHASRLRPPTLEHGAEYARLRVVASSRPIPRGPLVVRADLPADTRQALVEALLRVHEADAAAAAVLNVGRGQRFTHAARRQMPTLKSIAALAGVSYATVSRAVNGSGYVAPATAARIAAIVNELGYRPNGNALTLQGQRAPLVGLVVPMHGLGAAGVNAPVGLGASGVAAHDSPLASGVAAPDGLLEALRPALVAAGVPLVLCPVDGPLAASLFLDLLLDGRLGALIVTTAHADDPALADVARTGRAVVAVDVERAAPGMVVTTRAAAGRAVLGALGIGPATVARRGRALATTP